MGPGHGAPRRTRNPICADIPFVGASNRTIRRALACLAGLVLLCLPGCVLLPKEWFRQPERLPTSEAKPAPPGR